MLRLLARAFPLILVPASLAAQPPERGPRPGSPLQTALDADGDGRLSAAEIANAATALAALDKDGDGRLAGAEAGSGGGRGGRRGPPGGDPGMRGGPPPGGFPGGPGGFPGMGGMRGGIVGVLDTDRDGEVSKVEWLDAPDTLLTLDTDGDGMLADGELAPRGFGGFGPGGPGGPGRGGRGGRGPGGFGEASGARIPPDQVDPKDGVARIPDRATFKELSYQGEEVAIDVQLTGQEFVKFVVADAGTDAPTIYFMNTKTHRAHPMFVRIVGVPFGGGRRGGDEASGRAMMGVLVFRPLLAGQNGQPGLYTFEFEPNDAYPYRLVRQAFDLLEQFAPITKGALAYHPLPAAMDRYESEKDQYVAGNLPVFVDDFDFGAVGFLPLHQAKGFGTLRTLGKGDRPTPRDVVLLTTLPNEMPRVAGVISAVRQTPLSHVNLRCVQDDVPNAFIHGAADDEKITALVGKYVRYEVTADGYALTEATASEVEAHFAALRPPQPQVPVRNLEKNAITRLVDIAFADAASFGVKVANLATLRRIGLTGTDAPDGVGVPFAFYDAFMRHNGLYAEVESMQRTPGFATDARVREKALAALRKKVEKAAMPKHLADQLAALQASFPAGTSLRCRSSTNTEDLPGFSGAGLYDSFTHRPQEGHLAKTIQQVYASLWNFRAYEEREFHRIDHLAAAMGVLVHPNYKREKANGVAVTDDPIYQTRDQLGRRFYVNSQVGEDLVTNPTRDSIPEELLLHPSNAARDTVVRASNKVKDGGTVLTSAQLDELRGHLATIHREFRRLYGVKPTAKFAIEVEFKVSAEGALVIKQARPWVY